MPRKVRRLSALLILLVISLGISALWTAGRARGRVEETPGVAVGASPLLTPTPHVPTVAPAPAVGAALVVSATPVDGGVLFQLDGQAPVGTTEAVLWYDTVQGRTGRLFPIVSGAPIHQAVTITFTSQNLLVRPSFSGRLDYWWALRGPSGILGQRSGSVMLPPALRALAKSEQPQIAQPFKWATATTAHFRILFYPGSEAERDIEQIKGEVEAAFVKAARIFPPKDNVRLTLYLVPRIFWQGGVTYDGQVMLISYLDRNYAGVALSDYVAHEATHALAQFYMARGSSVGGLIGEGIAVYAAGGHYGSEPIDAWAAALYHSTQFVPLCQLRATFFSQQHEIAYLEGASFDSYLIRTYGLPAFRTFYGHDPAVPQQAERNPSSWCSSEAGRIVPGIDKSFGELEAGWLAELGRTPFTQEQADRLWGQIRFFDLMRDYQERRDPAARVLPPPPSRWKPNIQYAFASSALTETDEVEETLFVTADQALDAGQTVTANQLMDEIKIATATGVFTGTIGSKYAAVAGVLDRFARATRLGDATGRANTLAPGAKIAVPPGLWADYQLNPTAITITGTIALARVDRQAQPLNSSATREGLLVKLTHLPFGWRITAMRPDPERPAINIGPYPVPGVQQDLVALGQDNRSLFTRTHLYGVAD